MITFRPNCPVYIGENMKQPIIPMGIRLGKPRNIRGVALTDDELSRLDSHAKAMGLKRARVMAFGIDAYLQLLDAYTANPQDKTNPLHIFFEKHLRLSHESGKNDDTN